MTDRTLRTLLEHRALIGRLARDLCACPDEAGDLAQDAWAIAVSGTASAREPRRWIAGVVRNLARQKAREESRRRRRERRDVRKEDVPTPAELAERTEMMDILNAAVRRLPENLRTAVILRYYEGLPPRRIAARTGASIGAVKGYLKRALERLRRDLDASHDGDRHRWRSVLLGLAAGRATAALAASLGAILVIAVGVVVWPLIDGEPPRRAPRTLTVTNEPAAPAGRPAARPTDRRGGDEEPDAGTPVAGGGSSPVRGVLRDARTGEPLPEFAFLVEGAAGGATLRTDGSGAFEARVGADGPWTLNAREPGRSEWLPGEMRRTRHGLEAVIDVGPTYHLAPSTAVEPSGFEARLAALDPRRAHRTAFAPLRGDPDRPWVRFGPESHALQGAGPWRLEVRERDGHAYGAARVDGIVGLHADPLPLRLETRGAVRGRILDVAGDPVDQATMRLLPLDPGCEERETVTQRDGSFRIRWVRPGLYRLELHSILHREDHREVVVMEGLTAAVDLAPVPLERTTVHGVLAEFGTAFPESGPVRLVLRATTGPDRTFMKTVEPAPGRETRFAIEGVPPGDYEVTVHTGHFGRWSPSRLTVSVPGDGIHVTRARTAESDLELRVLAPDGSLVPSFSAFVRLDGRDDPATTKVVPGEDGRLVLPRVPLGALVEWTVRAPGSVPARGRALAGLLASRPTEITLRPGWGNHILVLDAHGEPLEGITVTADGRAVGATDAQGVLRAVLAAPPRRLGLADPGLRVSGGDLSPDGSYHDLIWGIRIVVAGRPQGRTDHPAKGEDR